MYQDASQFKLANTLIENDPTQEIRDQGTESGPCRLETGHLHKRRKGEKQRPEIHLQFAGSASH